jgi:photosystem II stability/assembly factor-like uncharacterized protein
MASENVGQICTHGGANHPDGDTIVTTAGLRGWSIHSCYRWLNGCCWPDEKTGWAVGARVGVGFTPPPSSPLYTQKAARLITSADGGKTWKAVSAPGGADLRGIRFADGNTGVAVGDRASILRTTDGGKTWSAVEPGVKANLYAVAFADAARGWIAGSEGALLETADAGATWKPCPSPAAKNLLGLHASGAIAVAVGADGTIVRLK